MLEENSLVEARRDLSVNVRRGAIGTVVMVLHHGKETAYEVEFFDDRNESIDLLTVSETDVEPRPA